MQVGTVGNSPLTSGLPQTRVEAKEHPSNLGSSSKHDTIYNRNLFIENVSLCLVSTLTYVLQMLQQGC